MEIVIIFVYLVILYVKRKKCGEGKCFNVSYDDRKVELCLVCWLGKDREEVDVCLLVKCFGR